MHYTARHVTHLHVAYIHPVALIRRLLMTQVYQRNATELANL